MNLRLAAMAALGREAAVPALVLTWIAATGFGGIDNSRAAPAVDRLAPSLAANAGFADAMFADEPQPIVPDASNVGPARASVTETVTMPLVEAVIERPPALAEPEPKPEPEPVVTASLTDPTETLRPEALPEQPAAPGTNSQEPEGSNLANPAKPDSVHPGVDSVEVLDECFVFDACVDRYLFALYQRAPKEDTIKIEERRKVTVRRRGKRVKVTRTFTKRVDEDFSWKDPKAAQKASMSMPDYVVGGMDRDFKVKLFYMLHAAEQAGLSPGITSAFRDDYRQSIASGLKAASNRSYHGGSLRGGYGHGLAADIVSVNGATRAQRTISSQALWKWVDANGKDFGIGRPYLDRDPPHVGPIDGQEYADKHPKAEKRAKATVKKHRRSKSRIASAHAR
jgi:hypothetical protein